MAMDDIRLVCEGVTPGRDQRWFNLVLGALAETFEPAARGRPVPAGSKANLLATVRGMQEALSSTQVVAIRDRDFLQASLLDKDKPHVHSLRRHCLESYLLEPEVLEKALGVTNVEQKLLLLAEDRFWPDVARAVLDAIGYELRQDRLRLGDELPVDKATVATIVQSKLDSFRSDLASKPIDILALVDAFAVDMRSDPLWKRVNGKDLLKTFASSLDSTILPGGDIESTLFRWCAENGPPRPLVSEVRAILVHVTGQTE